MASSAKPVNPELAEANPHHGQICTFGRYRMAA